jgi:hypothetical protein
MWMALHGNVEEIPQSDGESDLDCVQLLCEFCNKFPGMFCQTGTRESSVEAREVPGNTLLLGPAAELLPHRDPLSQTSYATVGMLGLHLMIK